MGVRTALTMTGWRFLGKELVETERTPRPRRAMDNPLIVLVQSNADPLQISKWLQCLVKKRGAKKIDLDQFHL